MAPLRSVEQALATMLAAAAPLSAETVPLDQADGRWLAEAVKATRDQPPFDASAMDGWAVRHADVAPGAALTIVGESAAGQRAWRPLSAGETVRISTGAPLPVGADRVVMQEHAERQGSRLLIGEAGQGRHIRARGCDFHDGEVLLRPGERLNPWKLALAAAAGVATLRCHAQPRLAVLATGNELVEVGGPAGEDQIYNSGGPSISAFARRQGAQVRQLAAAGDTKAAVVAALIGVAFDILVTVGGASVGDHDLVKPALKSLGAVLSVEGAALQPGKPVWFGRFADGRLVLGLPGNPASGLVCAELFLAPLLARLQGGVFEPKLGQAVLTTELPANGPRERYVRAHLSADAAGERRVRPFADQDSSLVSVMAASNVLIVRAPHAPAAAEGETVLVRDPA